MTKTQPNRITIFIMNLWVNRIRQLAVLAVALFFFSCKDEFNFLGYKNPNSKFDVQYIELPVGSSILLDSLRSSNYYNYSTETQRLLVGKYSDVKFGDVSSSTCTQFYTTTLTKLASTAVFDSVSLLLRFDFYTYGNSKTASTQEISVYELDQELNDTLSGTYFNSTPIMTKPGLLGSKSFAVNPTEFQTYIDAAKDTARTITMPLDISFGQRIFNSAIRYRDATTTADSMFINYSEFIKEFYGIAILPNQSDKIFGFSPAASSSRIILHYHTDSDTLQLGLSFTSTVSYNNITSDKGSTELAGLTQYHQEFYPNDDKRYIQSGTGVFTKLDVSKFLEFSDTIPNLIINSAELVIGNTEDGGALAPPQYLTMRVLKDNNRGYSYGTKDAQSIKDYALYKSFISPDFASAPLGVAVDNDSIFTVVGDDGGYFRLSYSKSEKKYNGYLTRFLQQLYAKEDEKTSLTSFALYPLQPSTTKSVNRVVFPKDNIKLRIYYTLPTVKD